MSEPEAGPVTLMDVALEAGVSLATASRAFNGSTRKVREELRERVLVAAKKLNYSANAPAQAMARGRTNVVGLLVHDIADPYFSSIAAGVMKAAEEHRLLVTLGSTMRRPERELEYLAAPRGQRGGAGRRAGGRVDGAGLIAPGRERVGACEQSGGGVAVIGERRGAGDSVVGESRRGARALAPGGAALGYRR